MNSTQQPPFSDSPWFWAYLFTTAALLALALIAPKYSARQAQIERQFKGRQSASHSAVNQPDNHQPGEQTLDSIRKPDENQITLKPLYLGLAALTTVLWLLHWRTRWSATPNLPPTEH